MEAWQAIFRNLYSGFLLRDFAGKIVPGVLLLFSICCLYREPKKLFEFLAKDVPAFTLVFVAGFAWVLTLGTQSLAEGLGIWRYFPDGPGISAPKISIWKNLLTKGDDTAFDSDTVKIDTFQSKASEDQKQQYERFVVIKEACGNLFVAGILSAPAWILVLLKKTIESSGHSRKVYKLDYFRRAASILGAAYIILVMVGLHRMHAQHVDRQTQYALALTEKRLKEPDASDGTLNIVSSQEHGDVTVDGEFFGNPPVTFKLKSGVHTVAVTLPGYQNWSRKIRIEPGSILRLEVSLHK